MIRPSFVPPPQIRRLRDLTRYRVDLVAARTAEKQRVEKLLEDAQIKLSVVASDIFGVSGREMMAALIAGQRDPKVLAQLARARMRGKITPAGGGVHRAASPTTTGSCWPRCWPGSTRSDADIAELEATIEEMIAPFATAVERLDEIPGLGPVAACAVIIAEIGLDMTRFPTAGHLASWARFAPGVKESAGQEEGPRRHRARQPLPGPGPRRGRGRRRQDRHLPRRTLPAHRPPPRQEEGHRRRRPLHPGHHLAPAVRPRGPLPRPRPRLLRHTRINPERKKRTHIHQLEALGYKVTLEPAA